jgi:RNA polymerase sigma factor (sigma-70 family)
VIPEISEVPEDQVEGFEDAFERLFLRAYAASYRILRSREDAEDVAMDTMARALRDWSKLDPGPDGWIVKVATHRSIDVWRRTQRQRRHLKAGRPVGSSPPSEPDLAVRQAVFALPKRQREVITLRYFLDLSEQEIATTLGCSTGSVKQHASRGLVALRRELSDDDLAGFGGA